MDSDSYYPFKVRAAQILGLMKLAAKSIETNGIQLLEGSKGEGHETKNTIQWIRNSTKGVKERIYGLATQEEEVHNLILEVLGIAPEENNKLTITASDEGNVNGGVSVTVKGIIKTIFNKNEASSFVQLFGGATRTRMRIMTGRFAINAGASESNNYVKLAHGFGNLCTGFMSQQIGADTFSIAITDKMVLNNAGEIWFRATASSAMPGAVPIEFEFQYILFG